MQPKLTPKNHKKMAKIYGLFGAMTGKLADTVMSVRNGEQIARKYQPVVFNPSTPAQVAQRAKLKLLSQLSAVMAPFIAIRREGPVSSRNLFTKVNFPLASFEGDTADVTLTSVQLTKSVLAFPDLSVTRSEGNVTIQLSTSAVYSRVVYVIFAKQADNTLRYLTDRVVEGSSTPSTFPTDAATGANIVVYGYGVRDNSEYARVTFGNMQVVSAETVAKVVTTRVLVESDITLTETKAAELPANRDVDEDTRKKKTTVNLS